MRRSDFLGRWIDLTAHLLDKPARHDPMIEICEELSRQFDAPAIGTVDLGQDRARIGVYSLGGPDAAKYVSGVGDHPLARYFRSTRDDHARCLADAMHFHDDPRVRMMMNKLREDRMKDFVFLPLRPRVGMDHRWLALASGDRLGRSASDSIDRLAGLIRALDAHGRVLTSRPASADRLSSGMNLSARELAVLVLTAQGLVATAIGCRLQISPRTVSKHQQNAYRKLGVSDRLSAVLRAQQLGLVPCQMIGDSSEGATVEAALSAGH